MKKLLLFIVVCFNVLYSQTDFSGKNAWLYDSALSSREFEGRKTGTIGGAKAANWIAEKFKEWGLTPGGENNSFLHKYPMLVTEESDDPKIIITNLKRGKLELKEGFDFALFTNSGAGNYEAELIFVGYGLSEPEWGWDDYQNIDVKGKVVLIIDGAPENTQYDWPEKNNRNYKFKTASKKGAAGYLMWRAPGNSVIKGASIIEENYNSNMPGAYILDYVVRDIFKGTGKTFDEAKEKLKKQPFSFNTGCKVKFDVKMKKIENGTGENVVGIIQGNDPKLKNEYIVFGAHMDHNGIGANGIYYQGADDNASGTAVVMELARALKKRGNNKRSIIFIGFGAEEQGLIGSDTYAKKPTVPKDGIIGMVNYDMVGVGDGGMFIGGMETMKKEWNSFWNTLSGEEKKKIRTSRVGLGGSDYTGFKMQGIPALSISSTGPHRYYHQVEDIYSDMKPEILEFVGSISLKWANFLANLDGKLADEFRDEKALLNSSNLTNYEFSDKYIALSEFKNEDFGKDFSEKGIKIVPFILNNEKESITYENIIKKALEVNKLKKNTYNYINFSLNSEEAKNLVYGSKLTVMPVINGMINDEALIFALNKTGISNYRISANKNNISEINSYLEKNKELGFEIQINENPEIIKDIKAGKKVIISVNFSTIKEIKDKSVVNPTINLLAIIINSQEFDFSELENAITLYGKSKTHLDIAGLLKKNEKRSYEFIKYLKKNGYSDEEIRNIFGNNLLREM